jgi:hypothetical protein
VTAATSGYFDKARSADSAPAPRAIKTMAAGKEKGAPWIEAPFSE